MKKIIVGLVLLFVVSSVWAQMSPASKDTAGRPVVFSGGAADGVGFTNIPLSSITGTSVLATDAEVVAAIAAIPPPEEFDGTIQTVKTMAVVGGAYPGMGASENLHLRGGLKSGGGIANVYVAGDTTFSNNVTVLGTASLPVVANVTIGGELLGDVVDEYVAGWAAFPIAGSLIDGGNNKTNLTIFAGIAPSLSNTRPKLTLKGGRLLQDSSQTWGDVEVWGQLVGKPQTNFVIRAADAVSIETLPQELHLRGGEEFTKGQDDYADVVIDSILRTPAGIDAQSANGHFLRLVADSVGTDEVEPYVPGRDLTIKAGDAIINPPQNYNGGDLYLAGGSNSNFPSKAAGKIVIGSMMDFAGNTVTNLGLLRLGGPTAGGGTLRMYDVAGDGLYYDLMVEDGILYWYGSGIYVDDKPVLTELGVGETGAYVKTVGGSKITGDLLMQGNLTIGISDEVGTADDYGIYGPPSVGNDSTGGGADNLYIRGGAAVSSGDWGGNVIVQSGPGGGPGGGDSGGQVIIRGHNQAGGDVDFASTSILDGDPILLVPRAYARLLTDDSGTDAINFEDRQFAGTWAFNGPVQFNDHVAIAPEKVIVFDAPDPAPAGVESHLYVDGTNLMFRATNGVAAKVMLEFAP